MLSKYSLVSKTAGAISRQEMKLNDKTIASMRLAKVFRENTDCVNCVDFAYNGESMISSSSDDSIVLYCCLEGRPKRTLYSKKYGCDLLQYTHATNAIIYSSNKIDDQIRYLSLYDNKYLRYFPGHTKRVVSLRMSPIDDTFISASMDKTIRLWDLRSPNCQGLMHLSSRPVVSYDPEGLIFAVGMDSKQIKLYDLRSFDKGPFITFFIRPDPGKYEWTSMKFAPDGKSIILSTNSAIIKLVDAFQGHELHNLVGRQNAKGLVLEASFTPDSQYVISGAEDGLVHMWAVDDGRKVAILDGGHPGASRCIQYNPKFMMMATACNNVGFWLPSIDE